VILGSLATSRVRVRIYTDQEVISPSIR
jgi:hypothetical protein